MADPVEAWSFARLPHAEVPLVIACDRAGALCGVAFGDDLEWLGGHARRAGARLTDDPADASDAATRGLADASDQLAGYLAGARRAFSLALRPIGGEFPRRVWAAIADIPFGVTWSYGQLARHLGSPGAARAVGRAAGDNPLPLVIPCHRVVGGDGSLTGFGGGLPRKRWLLAHEGARPAGDGAATLELFPGGLA